MSDFKSNAILIVLLVVIAFCGFLGFKFYSEKGKAVILQKTIQTLQEEALEAEAKRLTELNRINTIHRETTRLLNEQIIKADKVYQEKLDEANKRYDDSKLVADGLRDKIRDYNNRVPADSATADQKYATALGNSLAQCTATVVELEKFGWQCNAELDSVIQKWPVVKTQ